MGTAVLHARDCLAPAYPQKQSPPSHHRPIVSDFALASSLRITEEDKGLLGHKEDTSSAGLLPLPHHHVPAGSAPPPPYRSASSKFSSNTGRGSLPFYHKAHRMSASSGDPSATPLMQRWFLTQHNVPPSQDQQKLKLDTHFGRQNAKQFRANVPRQSRSVSFRAGHGGTKQPPIGSPFEKIRKNVRASCDLQRPDGQSRSHDAKQEPSAACALVMKNCPTVRNTRKSGWNFKVEEVLGCLNSVSNISSWLAMVDERWAGPSFFNSPPPSSLPVPSFTLKLATTSACREVSEDVDGISASQLREGPLLEVKRTWDVAFATKDLRRLLHLDHA